MSRVCFTEEWPRRRGDFDDGYAVGKKQGGVGVSQTVEAAIGQAALLQYPLPHLLYGFRSDGMAAAVSEHPGIRKNHRSRRQFFNRRGLGGKTGVAERIRKICIGLSLNGLGPVGYWMAMPLKRLITWVESFGRFNAAK